MFKRKTTKTSGGIASSFLLCFGISILLILITSFLATIIVNLLNDPTGHIGVFSLCALLLSAFCSGIICGSVKKESGVRFSFLVALAVVIIMLIINVIISGGRLSGGAFMNYGCYIGVSALSSLLGMRKKMRRHRH